MTRAALDALGGRLAAEGAAPATARHFRPNVVVAGGSGAHAEDAWARVNVGGRAFDVDGPCARCAAIELDPRSGLADKGARTLRTLAAYLGRARKPCPIWSELMSFKRTTLASPTLQT